MSIEVSSVIDAVGLSRIARACGVVPSAVHRWKSRNRLPRTEWTGETNYAQTIAELHGSISPDELLRRPGRAAEELESLSAYVRRLIHLDIRRHRQSRAEYDAENQADRADQGRE